MIANKEAQKILPIQDHLAITIAGLVGDGQTIARLMKAQTALYETERKKRISVDAAATLLANILHSNRYYPFWLQLLMGGYDSGPKLYSLDASGAAMEEKFVSTGSGSPTAYGVLEDNYAEDMVVKDALPIAARAVHAARERDSASGNKINIAIIDKKGFRTLEEKEVNDLLKKK